MNRKDARRVVLSLGISLLAWLPTVARSEPLDTTVQSAIQASQQVPDLGVAVAVVKDGKVMLSKGYGLRDRAKGLPVTSKTRFVLGSMSKAFTALALVMAEEEGRVDLSAPVGKYLPDFGLESSAASAHATAIDLLSHQSGLPRHDAFWYLSDFSRQELLPRLRFLGFNKDPAIGFRKSYQYNNLGYMTSGLILEAVTGVSWEETIRKKILLPLGMTDTTVTLAEMVQGKDVAKGYWDQLVLPYKDVTDIAAAAAINSTASDMIKWLGFLLRGGTTESGHALLSPQAFKRLFKPRIETAAGSGLYYGLGWRLDKYSGSSWIRHAGNMDGFLGVISFLPEKGIGTIVLTNQNDTPVPSAVTLKILANLLGGTKDPVAPRLAQELGDERGLVRSAPRLFAPESIASSRTPGDEWIGDYSSPAYGSMSVARSGAGVLGLKYQSHDWPMKLLPTTFGSSATYAVLLDLGGRTQEFPLEFTKGTGSKASGFSVAFEENAVAFRFERP